MMGNLADELETGDKITQDGLWVGKVVDANAEKRTIGGGEPGVEIEKVDGDGETFFKSDRQINLRWSKLN